MKSTKNQAKESKIRTGLLCFKTDCKHILSFKQNGCQQRPTNDCQRIEPAVRWRGGNPLKFSLIYWVRAISDPPEHLLRLAHNFHKINKSQTVNLTLTLAFEP